MEKLKNYIMDDRTGLKYKLVGDYYFVTGDNEPEEERPIGVWGHRRLWNLKQYHKVLYC